MTPQVLVLGGTAWLGRALAGALTEAGAKVTCLARGRSGPAPPGARWVIADRSEPGAYRQVRDRDWDSVLDLTWQPGMVRSALSELGGNAAHWTYVSSGSVYADHSRAGADESAAVLDPWPQDTAGRDEYGQAKVACEQLCQDAVGGRLLVVRSGLLAGYGDTSDRFGYWLARFAAAQEVHPAWAASPAVLVPDSDDVPTSALDVRDLVGWLVRCSLDGTTGTYDAVGEQQTLREVLDLAREVTGYEGPVERVPSTWLAEQDVVEFMGPRSLPLWLVDPQWRGFSARQGAAARRAGLRTRPTRELVASALAWEQERGLGRARQSGLSPREEADLLHRWDVSRP